jgi:arylsulfatase
MNRSLSFATAGMLCTLFPVACGSEPGPGPGRPSILLVTFDTTRVDHVSCYGYGKETTPNLDALAADGMRYENAYAVTSWTLPSHASIFTGKFPSAHGARYDPDGALNLVMEGGIRGRESWDQFRVHPLAPDQATLAGILADHGYATGAVVGGPWLKEVFGLGRGFLSYDDRNFETGQDGTQVNGRPAEDVTDAAIAFVEEHADRPFLLFVNYYDPHEPYVIRARFLRRFWDGPPPGEEQAGDWNLALYDSEILYTDHHFGRLLQFLRDAGLYENLWILVAADHGELLGENGLRGHGDSLSEPEIRIPLIVKEPGTGRPRGTSSALVQQVDLLPTLLARLEIGPPPDIQGTALDPGGTSSGHPIVAEVHPLPFRGRGKPWRQQGEWRCLVDGRYKFLWGSRGRHLLFDLQVDPGETENLLERRPEVARSMQGAIETYFAGLPAPGRAEEGFVDEETLQQLRAVGYLGGDEAR